MRTNLLSLTLFCFITTTANAYEYMGSFRSEEKFNYMSDDGLTYKCQIQSISFDEVKENGRHILRISPAELICDGQKSGDNSFSHTLPGHTFLVEAAFPGCVGKLNRPDPNPSNSCLEFIPFDREDVFCVDTGPSAIRDDNGQVVAVTQLSL